MKFIKHIIFGCLLSLFFISAVQSQTITLKCPPCRPIQSCDQCWETQEEADANCNSNSRQSFLGEKTINSMMVFPNPNNGTFTVGNPFKKSGEAVIMNQLGVIVRRFRISGEALFNYQSSDPLPKGVYHLKFTSDKGEDILSQTVIINGQ
ncbi:T9SS type A sorting domain-containing protein [Sediminitomix flava]|uniref:Putative secreted protein (Por secretion system target) n=1 Tax=Sediminitomix flava TaxID=379075 RepID=A0A315ZID4_SEDFL|nr:T9SS type A sorting domain-containing protein [Sediminitomix flava]PWJ44474.1 putative secreted protein (Por secretion system target) [Sediminitomix flava]